MFAHCLRECYGCGTRLSVSERIACLSRREQITATLLLLLPFVPGKIRKQMDELDVTHVSPPNMVRVFLHGLEQVPKCGATARNLRLAAIHSSRYIRLHTPNMVGMGNFVPSGGSGLFDPVFTYVEETGTDASLVVRRGRKAHRTGQGHVGTRPFDRQTELHLTCMCSSTDSARRA